MARILVVDDNDVDREQVRRLLGAEHEIVESATVQAAIEQLERSDVDCVLLDQRLPDGEGMELLSRLVSRRLPVLMLTAQGSEALAVQAMKGGARDYLPKHQLTRDALGRAVAHAIERNRLELELLEHQEQLAASNKALEEREAKLRVMLSQLPAMVWTTDRSLRYASLDGAALGALGVPGASLALVGTDARNGVPGGEPDAQAVQAHEGALLGESARYTARLKSRLYECLVEPLRGKEGTIVGTIGVALDRTEARQLEQELRQSQKMEAVGLLAGGVAHDFNNVLTAILGFAGFVREALPPSGEVREDLEQIVVAAQRARGLVNQLLAFSRRQPIEPRVFGVNGVLSDLKAMLGRLLGEDIELSLSLTPTSWNVRMDAGGLEQVIANLSINARDAMPGGGRLTLSTENLVAGEEIALAGGRRVAPGEHVIISVRDTGTGIAPELLERIFEPFFTTKEAGRGTGLGLSTCHGIVTQAGGVLSVSSEVGVGTTFRIYLPRERAASEHAAIRADTMARGAGETVLVIEDDEQVRAVIVRVLVGLGYRALEAGSGRSALELLSRHTPAVDLVLTDVVMPELGGIAVVEALRRESPSTRVLFMSGYSETAALQHPELHQGAPLLHKPLTPELLARQVRAVLDAPN
jgi:signal transduction histidine kinase